MDELDQSPIKVSWSQIRTHEECRHKAFLHREHKRTPAADKRNFFPGTVVDRVMRKWLESTEQVPGIMPSMVEDIMGYEEQETIDSGDGIVRWRNTADRDLTIVWCKRLVTRLEPILNKLVTPYDYEPALRFKTPVRLPVSPTETRIVHLVGEMDILVRDDDTAHHVWDLKATEDNQYWRKTVGQLVFYDLVVQCMFGGKPAARCGLIQPMCKDPVLYFTFGEDDYRQMWSRIHRYAIDVWRNNVRPKDDSKGCTVCDVKHACARYTESPLLQIKKRSILDKD